jgi:hypothetical protein
MDTALGGDADIRQAGLIHYVVTPLSTRGRSPLTTNLDRILGDMLNDVLQGYVTVREADAAYGTKLPGTGGRPRRFATFADYLADRIRHATDPAVEQQLRVALARVADGRRAGNRLSRACDTRLVNRLLAETGQERADRLRELRAELAAG